MKFAVAESLLDSLSYIKYRKTISDLLSQGKATGARQSDELLHYTLLNETRMNRLDKKLIISEENIQQLLNLKNDYTWLVLSEGWCGDAAQVLPVFNKMALITPRIDLKIVLRDDHPALMERYLTAGARAIPKLIILDREKKTELGSWGPRPQGAKTLVESYRSQYGKIDETLKTELQLWYLHDKGAATQDEIVALMRDVEQKR
jgi:hypothetical protein